MKATGIVRRIDDLGRVVIPKEIRRTLRLRDGDPMEIFTDREGTVILKKYSPIGDMADFAEEFAESARQNSRKHRGDHRQRSGHRRLRQLRPGSAGKTDQ